jgi:hypothetical protein
MGPSRSLAVLLLMAGAASGGGCRIDPLTGQEAQEAVEESAVDSQASALTAASIELATDFTIGEAAERAAGQVRDFVASQLPCAALALNGRELTIEYGRNPGQCTFRGHRFAGTHVVSVERDESDQVVVHHEWEDFGNGRVSVTGTAIVTWNVDSPSRRIQHELTWTRLSDQRHGTGSGDRTQRPLSGGLIEGFSVDGRRAWDGNRGRWELDIEGIEMRWTDPVPQAGAWTLTTPGDKVITFDFERIDASTIGVTASGGDRSIELKVNALGIVSRR